MEVSELVQSPEFLASAIMFLVALFAECLPQFQLVLKPVQKRAAIFVVSFVAAFVGLAVNHALTRPGELFTLDALYGVAVAVIGFLSSQVSHELFNHPGNGAGIEK